MPSVSAIFWDVGGVLLSNAWDHAQRRRALQHFGLNEEEFDSRHEMLVSSFERGKISLQEYLDRTVFYAARPFSRENFQQFMFSLSQPRSDVLELAKELAAKGRYGMATINNESRELNLYRIKTFGLDRIFTLFVSSCFVGFRKPEQDIYRLALAITQKIPEQSCFIDDRPLNLEMARRLGMHTIAMESAEQLRCELKKLGVAV